MPGLDATPADAKMGNSGAVRWHALYELDRQKIANDQVWFSHGSQEALRYRIIKGCFSGERIDETELIQMAVQALRESDFKETYAVHAALRAGCKSKLFAKDDAARKAADKLLKHLESEKSIYGRQCKMIRLMEKGATIAQLRKGLGSSRRTVFRYFLDLEEAGIDIKLEGSTYRVAKGTMNLIN